MYRPNLKYVALPFPEITAIEVLGWVRTPLLGKRRPQESEMVTLERALVSYYRASIVTFPLSLRVSEILPLLCSSITLFHNPLLVFQNFPMFPGD